MNFIQPLLGKAISIARTQEPVTSAIPPVIEYQDEPSPGEPGPGEAPPPPPDQD